jgi:hypothetical protein
MYVRKLRNPKEAKGRWVRNQYGMLCLADITVEMSRSKAEE